MRDYDLLDTTTYLQAEGDRAQSEGLQGIACGWYSPQALVSRILAAI